MRILLAFTLALVGCSSNGQDLASIEIDGHKFVVEIADEPLEHQRGLMGIEKLDSNQGMLFVFSDTQERGFWMKDTLIPLDLIAIDQGLVVGIDTMQPCEATPCPTTRTEPARYVLEVSAGTSESLGLEVGDPVVLPADL